LFKSFLKPNQINQALKSMDKLPEVYNYLHYTRKNDVYPSGMNVEELINTYFPESLPAFVQDMSDITAAFYGTMLAKARTFWGASAVDALAMATITEMGRFKAKQALVRYPELPMDGRGLLLILIAGIFSASPEYQFRIIEFSADVVKAQIMGNDRYYRVAVNKGVQELITWPTILHFLRGANAELGWNYEIDMDVKQLDKNGDCLYEFVIKQQTNTIQKGPALPEFLKMPGSEQIESYGKLSFVPLGKLSQYTGIHFFDLLKKAISLESYNYARLEGKGKILYMLAESMSARKCGSINMESDGYAVVKSRTQSGKKTHVTVSILDQENKEVYDFVFDYYLWEKAVFEDKFSMLKTEAEKYTNDNVAGLPEIKRIPGNNDFSFRAALPAFTASQCAEHYPGFPCVPAISIYQVLMADNLKWMLTHTSMESPVYTEEFMELIPVKMIPVGMELIVETRIIPLSKKRFRFAHNILNASDSEIHLIATIDVNIP
jgi:hypothetical protein